MTSMSETGVSYSQCHVLSVIEGKGRCLRGMLQFSLTFMNDMPINQRLDMMQGIRLFS